MATDLKKMNPNDLIAKIKSLQETIDKQSTTSLIDIDLQLDYIRVLYESYILLREDTLAQKEKNKKKANLSECGTLPLFDDMEEENNIEDELKEDINPLLVEEDILEKDLIQEIPDEIEKVENEAELSPVEANNDLEIEDRKIDESEVEINIEENQPVQELVSEIDDRNQEEYNEEIDIEDDLEDDIEKEIEEDIEEEFEEETVSIPNMDIELDVTMDAVPFEPIIPSLEEVEPTDEKNHFKAEIDIDSIEFAEDEYDDSDEGETKATPPSQSSHIGIPSGRPVYWGDEVDIEQPVVVKPTSIGDKYKNEKPSLNEIVSGFKPDASIGMKLQNESVTDLMKSIDMNNKFLFVKELFKGNGSAFTEEINNLNNHSKLEGAFRYLDKIKEKYNWDEKSEAYRQLYHLILRKYAK